MARHIKAPEGVKKIRCRCASAFQDQRNGKGIRAHNMTVKGFRCTVCGNEKSQ